MGLFLIESHLSGGGEADLLGIDRGNYTLLDLGRAPDPPFGGFKLYAVRADRGIKSAWEINPSTAPVGAGFAGVFPPLVPDQLCIGFLPHGPSKGGNPCDGFDD